MNSARRSRRGQQVPAAVLPVARVCVDTPLAHLDRLFDYQVSAKLDESAVPGVRVRVRFAGRLMDGWLLDRADESKYSGQLSWLERVVSAEAVLSPQIAALARALADRCAGTMSDVLRLAVPPRHARTEAEPGAAIAVRPARPAADGWARYPRGPAFLDALDQGRAAHACWQTLPGEDWPARLAEAAVTAAAAGRGALLVLPDYRDTARVHAAVVELAGPGAVVTLADELGPAERYRRWLAVRRGAVRIVVGTRATAFAPVADLGLMVLWDDGDDLHAEPRAPYPHARLVLGQRAVLEGAALLVAGHARTAETQLLVDTGWAHEIVAARDVVRAAAPRVTAIGEDDTQLARDPAARVARLPAVAFEAARAALRRDRPVLVQVPRRGYVPALACGQCRT
ncbi:MAG: primosome assembly protein PriA, partial [Pseudonocardiaceae bacterium]